MDCNGLTPGLYQEIQIQVVQFCICFIIYVQHVPVLMYCLEPVEKVEPEKVIIPVPIPFYVPVPMSMYTQPTPVPFPVPVPIPIPCFIPTTKKSADGILKHIKVMGAMCGMVSENTLI